MIANDVFDENGAFLVRLLGGAAIGALAWVLLAVLIRAYISWRAGP